MRSRFIACGTFILPVIVAAIGCVDDAGTSATTVPDAAQPNLDGGAPDAPGGDTATGDAFAPFDSGTDASDAADAAPVTVAPFATGLDGTGTALADGQVDAHWTVKDGAGNVLTAYSQTDALGYPGYWMAPSTTSKFISPFIDTVDPSGSGTFTYKTTFSLREGITTPVSLVIKVANDNTLSSVLVNGQAVAGVTAGSYSTFQEVTATTGFVVGTNAIEIVVGNSGGPTGMRAEFVLTAN